MKLSSLFICMLLSAVLIGQIKPKLEDIPHNPSTKHELESIQLNEEALQQLPSPKANQYNHGLTYASLPHLIVPERHQRDLQITRSSDTGIPIFIEGNMDYPMRTFLGKSELESNCLSYLDAIDNLLRIDHATEAFAITDIQEDDLGQQHVRMQQFYQGIPVYGAEIILHLHNNQVQRFNGRSLPSPNLSSIEPAITQIAATQSTVDDISQSTTMKHLEHLELELVGGQQQKATLVIYYTNNQPQLAWHVEIAPNLHHRWAYFIDAQTGSILNKHSLLCQFHGPTSPPNGPTTAQAVDLLGVTRTINTYEEAGNFFLIDAARPMFNAAQSSFPNDAVGVIWTIDASNTAPQNDDFSTSHVTSFNNQWNDPKSVSAHYNAGQAYNYFRTTFNRNSINGSGGNIVSLINVVEENGADMDNAFWNGYAMFYGNGDQAFNAPLAKSLDVAAHELAHGVIQNTANLEYFGESGALNESFADIFAAMVDRDDWQVGEDVVNPAIFTSGALRDLLNPNNGGNQLGDPGWQPASVSEQFFGNQDNGGVHINSGIPNRAFALFANEVGKSIAEQVFYRALTSYLVRSSQFIDLRIAVIQSANDLYNTSVANAAASAFDQVGIIGNEGTDPQEDVEFNPGDEFVLYVDELFDNIKIISPTGTSISTGINNVGVLSKPSITDDGSVVVYVSVDKRLQLIIIDWGAGTVNQIVLSNDPIWRNAAISKDGTKLAALTDDFDNRLFVFDLDTNPVQSSEYQLINPTTSSEGIETGDVEYADVLEWDFSGEFVMYDALNRIENTTSTIEYWDIGFIRVWNAAANTFGDGFISKLFSGLPENTSVGNPTFSKNSPFIIALDFIDSFEEEYFILGANIETGDVGTIFQNDGLSYPNYSVSDDILIFDFINFGERILAETTLNEDKISGNGDAFIFHEDLDGARWGVWFANGDRQITSVEPLVLDGNKIEVFPNPFQEIITVNLDLEKSAQVLVELYDVVGQLRYRATRQLQSGIQSIQLQPENISAGLYTLNVQINGKQKAVKIVKQ